MKKKIITFAGSSYLAEKRKTIEDHIELLESRYPEIVRRESVRLLRERLKK